MKKLLFILLLVTPIFCFGQNDGKSNNIHLEFLGNGYYYSFSYEFFNANKAHPTGDRVGISYFPSSHEVYENVSFFYEKNVVFGKRKLKTEFGIGASYIYFLNDRVFFNGLNYYSENDNNWLWLTLRSGIRYNINKKYIVRVGALPIIFLNELDNGILESLRITGSLSIGFNFNAKSKN